jgi:hypothetical protein
MFTLVECINLSQVEYPSSCVLVIFVMRTFKIYSKRFLKVQYIIINCSHTASQWVFWPFPLSIWIKENNYIYNSVRKVHLGINLIKKVKDVYTESYKTLMGKKKLRRHK